LKPPAQIGFRLPASRANRQELRAISAHASRQSPGTPALTRPESRRCRSAAFEGGSYLSYSHGTPPATTTLLSGIRVAVCQVRGNQRKS